MPTPGTWPSTPCWPSASPPAFSAPHRRERSPCHLLHQRIVGSTQGRRAVPSSLPAPHPGGRLHVAVGPGGVHVPAVPHGRLVRTDDRMELGRRGHLRRAGGRPKPCSLPSTSEGPCGCTPSPRCGDGSSRPIARLMTCRAFGTAIPAPPRPRPSSLSAIAEAFPGSETSITYGSTEAGSVCRLWPEDVHRKPGSVGPRGTGL